MESKLFFFCGSGGGGPNQPSGKKWFEMMRCKCCLPCRGLCAQDPYTLLQSSSYICKKMARLGTGKTPPEKRINTKGVDR